MSRLPTVLAAGWLAAHAAVAAAALPTVPAPAPAPGGAGILQAAFGMLVVVGLMLGLAWVARRLGLHRMGGSAAVKIVSSASLGGRERVVVVEVAGNWLVLGVTASQVNALHVLPAQDLPAAPPAQPVSPAASLFAGRLRQALGTQPWKR